MPHIKLYATNFFFIFTLQACALVNIFNIISESVRYVFLYTYSILLKDSVTFSFLNLTKKTNNISVFFIQYIHIIPSFTSFSTLC